MFRLLGKIQHGNTPDGKQFCSPCFFTKPAQDTRAIANLLFSLSRVRLHDPCMGGSDGTNLNQNPAPFSHSVRTMETDLMTNMLIFLKWTGSCHIESICLHIKCPKYRLVQFAFNQVADKCTSPRGLAEMKMSFGKPKSSKRSIPSPTSIAREDLRKFPFRHCRLKRRTKRPGLSTQACRTPTTTSNVLLSQTKSGSTCLIATMAFQNRKQSV